MRLVSRKVTLAHKDIRRIYLDSFPREERMPFPMMVAMSKLWNTEFTGFYKDGVPVGLLYLAHNSRLVFIMFLAVDSALRSSGFGSEILRYVREKFPERKIIVSIEPCIPGAPDLELRERRREFYLRNGYAETGYMMKLGGVEQEILAAGGAFAKGELGRFFVLYSFGSVWPKIWVK